MSGEPTVLGLLKEQIDRVEDDVSELRRDAADHRRETEQGFAAVLARLPMDATTPVDGEVRLNPARLTRSVRPWLALLMEVGKLALGAGIGAAAMSGSEAGEPAVPPVEQGP